MVQKVVGGLIGFPEIFHPRDETLVLVRAEEALSVFHFDLKEE